MPTEPVVQEAPPVEAAPEVSPDKPPVSEVKPEGIPPEGAGGEEPSEEEAEAEAEPEKPPEEEDPIAALSPEVLEQIAQRRGGETAYVQELLRRERQSATDTLSTEQQRTQAQQQELAQIQGAGRQAITNIGNLIAEAERGYDAVKAGEGDGARLNRGALYQQIDAYRDAWVQGQASAWNRELAETFTELDVVTASFSEADTERLGSAMKASTRQQTRKPLIKEMFTLLIDKALQAGYGMGLEDVKKYGDGQKAVEGQKDALKKLKGATPTEGPEGRPATKKTYATRTPDELAKLTPAERDAETQRFLQEQTA